MKAFGVVVLVMSMFGVAALGTGTECTRTVVEGCVEAAMLNETMPRENTCREQDELKKTCLEELKKCPVDAHSAHAQGDIGSMYYSACEMNVDEAIRCAKKLAMDLEICPSLFKGREYDNYVLADNVCGRYDNYTACMTKQLQKHCESNVERHFHEEWKLSLCPLYAYHNCPDYTTAKCEELTNGTPTVSAHNIPQQLFLATVLLNLLLELTQ